MKGSASRIVAPPVDLVVRALPSKRATTLGTPTAQLRHVLRTKPVLRDSGALSVAHRDLPVRQVMARGSRVATPLSFTPRVVRMLAARRLNTRLVVAPRHLQ